MIRRPPKVKKTISLESAIVDEMKAESKRQDRSISWLAVRAWRLARSRIAALPSGDPP